MRCTAVYLLILVVGVRGSCDRTHLVSSTSSNPTPPPFAADQISHSYTHFMTYVVIHHHTAKCLNLCRFKEKEQLKQLRHFSIVASYETIEDACCVCCSRVVTWLAVAALSNMRLLNFARFLADCRVMPMLKFPFMADRLSNLFLSGSLSHSPSTFKVLI